MTIATSTTFRVYHHIGSHCRIVYRTTDRNEAIQECERRNQEQIDAEGGRRDSGHYWTTDATDAVE